MQEYSKPMRECKNFSMRENEDGVRYLEGGAYYVTLPVNRYFICNGCGSVYVGETFLHVCGDKVVCFECHKEYNYKLFDELVCEVSMKVLDINKELKRRYTNDFKPRKART